MSKNKSLNFTLLVVTILCCLLRFSTQKYIVSNDGKIQDIAPSRVVSLGDLNPFVDVIFNTESDDVDYIYKLEDSLKYSMKLSISFNHCIHLDKQPSVEITFQSATTGKESREIWDCRKSDGFTITDASQISIRLSGGFSDFFPFQVSLSITAYHERLTKCPTEYSFDCNGFQDIQIVHHCIHEGLQCNGNRNCGEYEYDENTIECGLTTTTTEGNSTTEGYWPRPNEGDDGPPIEIITIIYVCMFVVFGITVGCCFFCCCRYGFCPYISRKNAENISLSSMVYPVQNINNDSNPNENVTTVTGQRKTEMELTTLNEGLPTYHDVMKSAWSPQ